MNIIDKAVKSGVFAPVYLLYGEEDYLMQFNKTKLRDALISPGNEMNLSTWKGDSFDLGQFRDQAQTLPFFADHRLLIAEYCGLFKKGGQEMAELLPQLPETSVVLFLEHEVDNRGKLIRYVKENGAILECKHLKEKEMKDWILLKLGRE